MDQAQMVLQNELSSLLASKDQMYWHLQESQRAMLEKLSRAEQGNAELIDEKLAANEMIIMLEQELENAVRIAEGASQKMQVFLSQSRTKHFVLQLGQAEMQFTICSLNEQMAASKKQQEKLELGLARMHEKRAADQTKIEQMDSALAAANSTASKMTEHGKRLDILLADCEEQLEAATSREDALKASVSELSDSMALLEEQTVADEQRIQTLEASMTVDGNTSQTLKDDVHRLSECVQDLQMDLKEVESSLHSCQVELTREQAATSELTSNLKQEKANCMLLETTQEGLKSALATLREQSAIDTVRIELMESTIKTASAKESELSNQIERLNDLLRDTEKQLGAACASEKDLNTSLLDAREESKSSQVTIDEQHRCISHLEDMLSKVKASRNVEKEELESRLDNASKAEIEALSSNAALRSELLILQAAHHTLEDATGKLKTESAGMQEELATGRSILKQKETELLQRQMRTRELEHHLAELISERDSLKVVNKELQDAFNSLQEQLAAQQIRMEVMEAGVLAHGESARKLREEIERLSTAHTREKHDLMLRLDDATKASNDASTSNAVLRSELSILQAAHRTLEETAGRMKEEAADTDKELTRARVAFKEMEEELAQVHVRARELDRRLAEYSTENVSLKATNVESQAAVASLREQAASDKVRMEAMSSTISAGEEGSKAMAEEVKRLETALQLEKKSREAFEQENVNLRVGSELYAAFQIDADRLGELEARLQDSTAVAHNMSVANAELRGELSTLQAAYCSLEQTADRVPDLDCMVKEMQAELDLVQTRARDLDWRLGEATTEIRIITRTKEELEGTIALLREQEATDKARIEVMETSIAAGGDRIQDLEEERKRMSSALQLEKESREECERQLESLSTHTDYLEQNQKGLVEIEKQTADLQRQLDDATKASNDASTSNAVLRSELSILQAAHRTLEETAGRMKEEAADTDKELTRARVAFKEMEEELAQVHVRARELDRRLAEYSTENVSLKATNVESQAAVASLREQAASDKVRMEAMSSTISAGEEGSKAMAEEVKRLETALQLEKKAREAFEQEIAGLSIAILKQDSRLLSHSKNSQNDLEGRVESVKLEGEVIKSRVQELELLLDDSTTALEQASKKVIREAQEHEAAAALALQYKATMDSQAEMQQRMASQNSTLLADLAALKEEHDKKVLGLSASEALQAEMQTNIKSLHLQIQNMQEHLGTALSDKDRLQMLLQEADTAALQLQLDVNRAADAEAKIITQDKTIKDLSAECNELKMQVMFLTRQLELAVADLETEAKQTEQFTNSFLNLSQSLQPRCDKEPMSAFEFNFKSKDSDATITDDARPKGEE